MKRWVMLLLSLYVLMLIIPYSAAIIEEDWGNYTRIEDSKRDGAGITVTLSPLKKNYSNNEGNYTITARDFDAEGTVVLDITFMGKKETVILRGEWNENRTKIILTPPVELFNKMMIITPKKIIPPTGIFTCCPEAEINVDLIRPELFLEFKEINRSISYEYKAVDPYANWSYDPESSPFNDSTVESESTTTAKTTEKTSNSYRMDEQIPVEFIVTNNGDAESHDNIVYIDTDGLIIEEGMSHYQLPAIAGTSQKTIFEPTSQSRKMKLRFPDKPEKLNYRIHAYVKGVKEGITYYYDDSIQINLLPYVTIQKSATSEIMLPTREEVERIYHSIDANEIYRWLQGGEAYVSIGVTNHANYEIKGLKLVDSLPKYLTVDNQSLEWIFDLKTFESKEFKYRVKPLHPGAFRYPQAILTYFDLNRTWSLLSASPSTEVHGHCVQVFKKPDKPVIPPGGNITIDVTIRNSGDMPSRVKINDTLPENSTFINGTTYYEGILSPKESASISYSLLMGSEGQVQLPAPRMFINGVEGKGCGDPILSKIMIKEPLLQVAENNISLPQETPVTIPTPPQQKYGILEGLIPALMLVLSVAVLIILHRTNE